MFTRVLLCYDGSAAGRRALRRGATCPSVQIPGVRAFHHSGGALDPVLAAGARHACLVNEDHGYRRMLDESVEWSRGGLARRVIWRAETPSRDTRVREKLAVDLIVLGYYSRPSGGFGGRTLAHSLAERARCCILVAIDPRLTPASLSFVALEGMRKSNPAMPWASRGRARASMLRLAMRRAARVPESRVEVRKPLHRSRGVEVSAQAGSWRRGAGRTRACRVILRESTGVVRCAPQVLIVRHRSAW